MQSVSGSTYNKISKHEELYYYYIISVLLAIKYWLWCATVPQWHLSQHRQAKRMQLLSQTSAFPAERMHSLKPPCANDPPRSCSWKIEPFSLHWLTCILESKVSTNNVAKSFCNHQNCQPNSMLCNTGIWLLSSITLITSESWLFKNRSISLHWSNPMPQWSPAIPLGITERDFCRQDILPDCHSKLLKHQKQKARTTTISMTNVSNLTIQVDLYLSKNIQKHFKCLKSRNQLRLTGTSPIAGFSFSLPGKTLQHPEDLYLPGMQLWPANHNTIATIW